MRMNSQQFSFEQPFQLESVTETPPTASKYRGVHFINLLAVGVGQHTVKKWTNLDLSFC